MLLVKKMIFLVGSMELLVKIMMLLVKMLMLLAKDDDTVCVKIVHDMFGGVHGTDDAF